MKISDVSEKQKEIVNFMYDDNRTFIADGSVRCGKTVIMAMCFILWAMLNFTETNFAICGKTVQSAIRNVIMPLMTIDGLKSHLQWKGSEHVLVVTVNGRTNKFYVFGGRDESSYQLIQGITLAGVLFDEVALMPRSFVEQAMARTLTYANAKLWFNCNPEGKKHWFYQEWIVPTDEGKKKRSVHVHFTLEDNPILTEDEITAAKAMYSGVFYKRYIEGLWVMAEGLVYDMFSEERHVVDKLKLPETDTEYYVSCDYGIQNATVFLLWARIKEKKDPNRRYTILDEMGIKENPDRWICIREWYYSGRDNSKQKTVNQLAQGCKDMLGKIKPERIIVDPSASALIVELKKMGYKVKAAKNDVHAGIDDVGVMLNRDLLLFSSSCKNTIDEFSVYVWDDKINRNGQEVPVKENDHAMDAVRYFVHTMGFIKRETGPAEKQAFKDMLKNGEMYR